MPEAPPIVLSIAGFDPSSGAGVTADIKTIVALGCYGVTAITALTVQSTAGVRRVLPVEPGTLTDSLEELSRDVKVSAVHIGMLGTGGAAEEVHTFLLTAKPPNVVLDPVLVSSSGTRLLDDSGLQVLIKQLLPVIDVITPNIDEAAVLTGLEVKNPDQMARAAGRLHEMGAPAVVITGGHLDSALDLLSVKGQSIQTFRAEHLNSPHTHGTGCAFSTALACQLALGQTLPTAVSSAKAYVLESIKNSYSIGKGTGPVNHMHKLREVGPKE
jgi:hydroxymethylpyrimidine/phosphomethylpyrimidine kinase